MVLRKGERKFLLGLKRSFIESFIEEMVLFLGLKGIDENENVFLVVECYELKIRGRKLWVMYKIILD